MISCHFPGSRVIYFHTKIPIYASIYPFVLGYHQKRPHVIFKIIYGNLISANLFQVIRCFHTFLSITFPYYICRNISISSIVPLKYHSLSEIHFVIYEKFCIFHITFQKKSFYNHTHTHIHIITPLSELWHINSCRNHRDFLPKCTFPDMTTAIL